MDVTPYNEKAPPMRRCPSGRRTGSPALTAPCRNSPAALPSRASTGPRRLAGLLPGAARRTHRPPGEGLTFLRPRSRYRALPLAIVLASVSVVVAAQPADLRATIDRIVAARQRAIVGELVDLVSLPNVTSDAEGIRANVRRIEEMFTKRGFTTTRLETGGNPLVFAERRVPGATRTLLLYAHYDGQPVEAARWQQASPFVAVLRDGRLEQGAREVPLGGAGRLDPEWRLYARSAADDKAPIVALLAAIDALAEAGLAPTSNLRVVLDGEEERGSPSLVPAIARYRSRFAADAIVILDGPTHPSGRPTLAFGARGILTFTLTVYGPRSALHSGHYGNWVPNPAMRLAQLLASMKDERGRVLIDGFYDGITEPGPAEQAMLDGVPDAPDQLKKLFGIASPENPEWSLQFALQAPSLNVRGLASGSVSEPRTIIPDRAEAAIDVRLVKETPSLQMIEKVRAHLVAQGYYVVSSDPDDQLRARYARIVKLAVDPGSTNAFRTSALLPICQRIAEALGRAHGEPPVRIRTMGGTVPVAPFVEALGAPAVVFGTVNFDNNQHADNENLRLGHLYQGITSLAALLTM